MTPQPADLFASVRRSRDRSLIAFAAALLVAAALSLGAFVPRMGSPEASAPAVAEAPTRAAVVASR